MSEKEQEVQGLIDQLAEWIDGQPDEVEVDSMVWALLFAVNGFAESEEAKEEIRTRVDYILGSKQTIKEPSGRIILAH